MDDTEQLVIFICAGVTFFVSCSIVSYAFCFCKDKKIKKKNKYLEEDPKPKPKLLISRPVQNIFENETILAELNSNIDSIHRNNLRKEEGGKEEDGEEDNINVLMTFYDLDERQETDI